MCSEQDIVNSFSSISEGLQHCSYIIAHTMLQYDFEEKKQFAKLLKDMKAVQDVCYTKVYTLATTAPEDYDDGDDEEE